MKITGLEEHLRKYGIRRLYGNEYERWRKTMITAKIDKKLEKHIDSNYGRYTSLEFMDFIGDPKIASVQLSTRWDAICQSGEAISKVLLAEARILDVGCGIGHLTTWYALQDSRRTVVGIDFSSKSIKTARDYAVKLHVQNVSFECSDIAAYHSTQKFDVITDSQALYCIRDMQLAIGNLPSLLEPNGCIISIPALPTREEQDEYLSTFNEAGLFLVSFGHVFHKNFYEYTDMFPMYGFKMVEKNIDVDIDLVIENAFLERERRHALNIMGRLIDNHFQEVQEHGFRIVFIKYAKMDDTTKHRFLKRLEELGLLNR